MVTSEMKDSSDGGFVSVIGEENRIGPLPLLNNIFPLINVVSRDLALGIIETSYLSPKPGRTYIFVAPLPLTAEILFGVDQQSLSPPESLLEQGITRRERNSIISAFDHKVDVGKHGLHFGKPQLVMTEKIRSGNRLEGGKHRSRDEGRHWRWGALVSYCCPCKDSDKHDTDLHFVICIFLVSYGVVMEFLS